MNSLRLVETINENNGGFAKEETRAQAKAREAKQYFVERLNQISADFSVVSDDLNLQYSEYYFETNKQSEFNSSNSETFFEGHVVYDPNEEQLNSNWQPATRIIFGRDGRVYYQPQEYAASPDHVRKCYPIDELDRYDIRTNDNAYNFLVYIRDMTLDKIEQSRKQLSKIGGQVLELTT